MRATQPPRVRVAVAADLDALLALEEATFEGDRISRRQWRRHIASGSGEVLVSGPPGNIDAAAVVLYRRNSRVARLYSLAVHARRRASGLASALLAAAEAGARRRGCHSLSLEVRADNHPAIALYEHRGYVRRALIPHFYEDGANGWRYVKRLVPAC